MREETIAAFFDGKVSADVLDSEATQSIMVHDSAHTSVAITDMDRLFRITRDHILKLCDAAIEGQLNEASLNAIAFALIATDHFEWDDDIIAEVLFDWSAPEINYPLTSSNLAMNKSWLLGTSNPPERPPLPNNARKGNLVSQRLKVAELHPSWSSYSATLRKLELDK